MPSLADAMKGIDAQIYDRIGEKMLVGAVEVPGIFMKRYHEVTLRDGTVEGVAISFDCQYSETVASLEEGDSVTVMPSAETFVFIRRIPNRGDETGRTIVELGTP